MSRNATFDPKSRTLTTTTGVWKLARHDARPDGGVDAVVSLAAHQPDAASTRRFGYRYSDGRWWQVAGLWGTGPDAQRMVPLAPRQYTVAWPALCDLLNLARGIVPAADEQVEGSEAA